MHVQEEFTHRQADTTYYKKRTLGKIGKRVEFIFL
jgi:hypothetical protein